MKKQTILQQVLLAIVPYSSGNLKLSFAPRQFLYDLEQQTLASRRTLASTISRAKRLGMIEFVNGRPYLTQLGQTKLPLPLPYLLGDGRWLMVIFDVPEERKSDRYHLRNYLKELGYKPLQKSVWVSQQDNLNLVKEVVGELGLGRMVMILRCEPVFPPMEFTAMADTLLQMQ